MGADLTAETEDETTFEYDCRSHPILASSIDCGRTPRSAPNRSPCARSQHQRQERVVLVSAVRAPSSGFFSWRAAWRMLRPVIRSCRLRANGARRRRWHRSPIWVSAYLAPMPRRTKLMVGGDVRVVHVGMWRRRSAGLRRRMCRRQAVEGDRCASHHRGADPSIVANIAGGSGAVVTGPCRKA
jgi:hypothetical protein